MKPDEPLLCSQGGIPFNKIHLDAKDNRIAELHRRLMAELSKNARLEAALRECAADYKSPPTTVLGGVSYLAEEFRRRQQVAADAVEQV